MTEHNPNFFKELKNFQKNAAEGFTLSTRLADPQCSTPPHQHDFVELVLILKGTGKHEAGGLVHDLHKGGILVIPVGCIHRYFSVSPDFAVLNILFQPESLPLPRLDIALMPGFSAVYTGKSPDKAPYVCFRCGDDQSDSLIGTAMDLWHENETRASGCHFVILGLFMTLLGKLARIYSGGEKESGKLYVNVAGVLSWLNAHYHEDADIAHLCRIAGMSKSTLMRNFRRATGTTPLQYQVSLRIAEASQMLRATSLAVSEIAFKSGFADINYFGRCFKRAAGMPPRAFRKMNPAGNDKSSGNSPE